MREAKEKRYLWEDERWVGIIYACLEKIQELLKQKPFDMQTAKQIKILAETVLRLDYPWEQEESQPAQFLVQAGEEHELNLDTF